MKSRYAFTWRLARGSLLLAGVMLPYEGKAQQKTGIEQRARAERERSLAGSSNYSVIDGIVTDTMLSPLAGADVTVVGTGVRVVSSENGRFRMLQVPSGQYLLIVRRIGFAPTSGIIEVPASDTVRLSYSLTRSSLTLDTVRVRERRVTLRMLEFEQRRLLGVGQFITREQIEKRGSTSTADYLRILKGVDVSPIAGDQFSGRIALSRREGGSLGGEGAGACAMQVLLDGIVMPRFFNLDLLPPPKQIAGIEVYSGAATVPPQFSGADRRCGLIAVWTRDGY